MALSFWVLRDGPSRYFDNFVHERTLIHRRLIVACRRSGKTDMFVITLVPSSDARG
ncbi:hypothetical protein HUV04_19610, partial [Odoribacter splanchnicus]|nr:hypothetical protein [Odoribacter splanchnicus]